VAIGDYEIFQPEHCRLSASDRYLLKQGYLLGVQANLILRELCPAEENLFTGSHYNWQIEYLSVWH
jgi:hypothetical protein